ncbi:hypothetical protein MNQ96_11625 [Sphingopyxis granuli]|uniref:TetR/AcrR family transcriptional regulator n=1 Tax=Sphingopyxis granuli TaxID=267128 RepID=UPI001F531C38|nr:hypothetical protein [Sphingopyxis granuli]UNK78233.1 hypothetical protein MNQ96_11625 [Sphingopyxis granuli]
MADMTQKGEGQARMRAADRAAMMVEEADRQINLRRSARIAPADIAGDLGISRSLIYSYFADPSALLVAVLDRHARLLTDAGIEQAVGHADFISSMIDCSLIYLDHVVDHGAAIELCFRDKWLARNLDGTMRTLGNSIYRRLARQARCELNYSVHDALGVVQILQAIPEEGARLVRNGDISIDVARGLCRRLVTASIEELRPAA